MFIMDVFGIRAIMGLQESDFPGCVADLEKGDGAWRSLTRTYFLYLLLAGCFINYVRVTDLQETDDLYKACVGKLTAFASALNCNDPSFTFEYYSKAVKAGKIPYDRDHTMVDATGRSRIPLALLFDCVDLTDNQLTQAEIDGAHDFNDYLANYYCPDNSSHQFKKTQDDHPKFNL